MCIEFILVTIGRDFVSKTWKQEETTNERGHSGITQSLLLKNKLSVHNLDLPTRNPTRPRNR